MLQTASLCLCDEPRQTWVKAVVFVDGLWLVVQLICPTVVQYLKFTSFARKQRRKEGTELATLTTGGAAVM